MNLERKIDVIPARDCFRACECSPPCGGRYGIRSEIWVLALRDLALGVGCSLTVYTTRNHPVTPPPPYDREPAFELDCHAAFVTDLDALSNASTVPMPTVSDCRVLDGPCWSGGSSFTAGAALGPLVDLARVEQPETFWSEFERVARPELDRLLTMKVVVEQHERCPRCDGKGYARRR